MPWNVVIYTYDDLNRLLSASTTAASTTPYRHQFAYTMLGNITGMSTSSATTTYTYAETGYANPHAVTSVGGTTYTYDNNGNVTAIGSLDYTWDWRNRLASAERSGGGITTYGYDHTGQRVFQGDGECDHLLSEQVLQRRLELAHRHDHEAHLLAGWDAPRDGRRRFHDRHHDVPSSRSPRRHECHDR